MNYVIIGVGAAGIAAAQELRARDGRAAITMVSKDTRVHSRCMLHYYIAGERDEKGLNFVPEDFFEKNGIRWIRQAVETIDAQNHALHLASGETLPFDRLLIASGANSFIPPVPGFREGKNVYGLRDLSDAEAIADAAKHARRAVIIGSGLVGLDAAYALLQKGLRVSIVEMADTVLPVQLDAHAAGAYKERFERAGAQFYLGRKAAGTRMDQAGRVAEVILDDEQRLPLDLLIVTAGVRPAADFAANSPILCNRGITVDACMRTNVPDIYAAGDVTGRSGIWPSARGQGRIAADNMSGASVAYTDTFAAKNTINFYHLSTLCVGAIHPEATDRVRIREDRNNYQRVILRGNLVRGILLQGDISHAGIWQHIIKNRLPLPKGKDPFDVTYADFYHIQPDGTYGY